MCWLNGIFISIFFNFKRSQQPDYNFQENLFLEIYTSTNEYIRNDSFLFSCYANGNVCCVNVSYLRTTKKKNDNNSKFFIAVNYMISTLKGVGYVLN